MVLFRDTPTIDPVPAPRPAPAVVVGRLGGGWGQESVPREEEAGDGGKKGKKVSERARPGQTDRQVARPSVCSSMYE